MSNSIINSLHQVARVFRVPFDLVMLLFKDERKCHSSDHDALASLVDNLSEGAIS